MRRQPGLGEVARRIAVRSLFFAQAGRHHRRGLPVNDRGHHLRLIVVLTPCPRVSSSNQRAVTVLVWV
ncbi:hypothetical protein [Lysobacter gummosus]|uniref:hypothetical protein n=1 Tax=Lysobacter gummosus TaxID=262324 RepID=UPI0036349B70